MTIERTRELLGSKISHLTDQEVSNFIFKTDKIITELMKKSVNEINTIQQKGKKIK